jgi:hypothetical protein
MPAMKVTGLLFCLAGKWACLGEQLAWCKLLIFFTSLLQKFTFKSPRNASPFLLSVTASVLSLGHDFFGEIDERRTRSKSTACAQKPTVPNQMWEERMKLTLRKYERTWTKRKMAQILAWLYIGPGEIIYVLNDLSFHPQDEKRMVIPCLKRVLTKIKGNNGFRLVCKS